MKQQLAQPSAAAKAKAPAKVKVKNANNPMQEIFIEKVVLSAGAVGDDLVKSKKLLELVSAHKAQIVQSKKRIPDFGVRPGLEVGTRVTLRNKEAIELLKRLLGAIDNKLKKKQITDNHFSFGLEEYIEIPGLEYQRDIGIRGFNVTIVFSRPGSRVRLKKIKSGRFPKRQQVAKEEIIKYMEAMFKTSFS